MKPLRIVGPAEAEFREAVAWYRDRDPRVAQRFTAEVRHALRLIEEFPQIGGRVPDLDDPDVRQMPVHTFPYHVIFVVLGETIEVVAFAHSRRKPCYFISRLPRR